jgi:hypothetical protein
MVIWAVGNYEQIIARPIVATDDCTPVSHSLGRFWRWHYAQESLHCANTAGISHPQAKAAPQAISIVRIPKLLAGDYISTGASVKCELTMLTVLISLARRRRFR